MRYLTRGIFVLGLLWLEIILYQHLEHIRNARTEYFQAFDDNAQIHNPGGVDNDTTVILLFGGIIGVAVIIGTIVAMAIVPAIGETIGNFFFNPNQQIEKNPHSNALAKIAQGDYEGGIEEYKKTLAENPDDMHALKEIIHLYCDKLHDFGAAEHFLEEALKSEWPPDQGAFIASRLVDVYWNHRRDATRARHVLMQIAETMPDTKHAANAVHRLHEIERALADEEAGILHHHAKSDLPPGEPNLQAETEASPAEEETDKHAES